jgi:hypothetical protein
VVDINIYVECGGDQASLKTKCRKGFRLFFEKILPEGKMPKIIACGSRKDTYDRFCTAILGYKNTFCILLVDSEGPVADNANRWFYLKARSEDGWNKPDNADEENVHFMVQCMESWFIADKKCLEEFYSQGFILNALPKNPNIEKISKADIYNGLRNATRNTKTKGKYGKGGHSFDILSQIDPVKVCGASNHAEILIRTILNKMED